MLNLLILAADGNSQPQNGSGGSMIGLLFPLILVFVLMYFVMIRPQKKKQKEEQKMKESLQVGDEILTIGGIYGRIVSIKEDSIVLESAADHSKIKFAKWAVSQNLTVHEAEAVVKPKKEKKAKKDDAASVSNDDEKLKLKED